MMKGAFESEKTIHSFIPEYVPKPVAFGTYKSRPDTHFYLAEFVDMDETHPDPKAWATTVSTLHKRSMGKSPGGKFGFHMQTHMANVPINNTWNSSWEQFWTQQLSSLRKIEERRGPEDEFTALKKGFFELVIPRYLGPLESNGRSIQPCLVGYYHTASVSEMTSFSMTQRKKGAVGFDRTPD